ncbi:MAG TPA: ESX secretion-associated protein EspG [Pseudonocardiaceae bacterium]|nr:ESX secretion-associated protein EspG [Pseudonocardiaceae bacterium]
MLAQPVRLSVGAVTRMLHLLRLGQPQIVIQPTATWEEPEHDSATDVAVWAEFTTAGLVDRPGRLTPEAMAALTVLGQASVEYFGWLTTESGQAGAVLAAALGQQAVYVVRRGDRLRLVGIADTGLVEAFVESLSGPPPARIDAVSVRIGDLHGVDDRRDVALVRALLARPVTGLGELYVAARDQRGRYRMSEEPVRYRDTAAGRVMVIVSGDHLSIAPGANAVLTERLRRVYEELAE